MLAGMTTKSGPAKAPKDPSREGKGPSTRKQLMENEVLDHATRLFAEKGFAGTNLQDIATSMGLKRPALYYYFKSKDELLERLIVDATLGPAQELRAIAEQTSLDATHRLHAMARNMVHWVAAHTDRFLLLVKSESELSPEGSEAFNDGRRAALDEVTAVIQEGVESGQFRQVDANIAAFGVWGICNWVAWWYRPDGRDSIETISAHLADMAVNSVKSIEHSTPEALSPQTALVALRDDLDRLERLLSDQSRTS